MAIAPVSQQNRPSQFGSGAKGQGNARAKSQQIIPEAKTNPMSLMTGLYSLVTLPGILRNQIENFVSMGARHFEGSKDKADDAISVYSRILGFFIKPFKPSPEDFSEHKTPDNPKGHVHKWLEQINPDVSDNNPLNPDVPLKKRDFRLINIWKRLLHPTVARTSTSFVFMMQNIVENLFSKSKATGAFTGFFEGFKRLSSLTATFFGPTGTLSSSIFSFFGKQELVQASSLWGLTGGILMAACSNLSSLVKTLVSFEKSSKNGVSLKESMKEQDMNSGHLLQAFFGGITAIPSMPGMFARAIQIMKDTREKIIPSSRALANLGINSLHNAGLLKRTTIKEFEDKGEAVTRKIVTFLKDSIVPALEGFVNNRTFKGLIFKHIMPDNHEGKISFEVHRRILNDVLDYDKPGYVSKKYENFYGLPTADPDASDAQLERKSENMLFGFIPKSESFFELFKMLGPLQSAMMMLPPIFTGFKDDEIQDHGVMPMRVLDRAMGLVSGLLTIPNYLLYILSTRAPQMILYWFDRKQRIQKAKGNETYNAMNDIVKLRDKLKSLSLIPFTKYLADMLDYDLINSGLGSDAFTNSSKTNKLFTKIYENMAMKQEYASEAPAAVQYIRNLMRVMINKFKFFRITVEEGKLSPSQKGKQMIAKAIDTVQNLVSAIPFGSVLSPVFMLMKKPFEVRTIKPRVNPAEAQAQMMQAPNNSANPVNSGLGKLAEMMKSINPSKA